MSTETISAEKATACEHPHTAAAAAEEHPDTPSIGPNTIPVVRARHTCARPVRGCQLIEE
jgi:hypothetical protein